MASRISASKHPRDFADCHRASVRVDPRRREAAGTASLTGVAKVRRWPSPAEGGHWHQSAGSVSKILTPAVDRPGAGPAAPDGSTVGFLCKAAVDRTAGYVCLGWTSARRPRGEARGRPSGRRTARRCRPDSTRLASANGTRLTPAEGQLQSEQRSFPQTVWRPYVSFFGASHASDSQPASR